MQNKFGKKSLGKGQASAGAADRSKSMPTELPTVESIRAHEAPSANPSQSSLQPRSSLQTGALLQTVARSRGEHDLIQAADTLEKAEQCPSVLTMATYQASHHVLLPEAWSNHFPKGGQRGKGVAASHTPCDCVHAWLHADILS